MELTYWSVCAAHIWCEICSVIDCVPEKGLRHLSVNVLYIVVLSLDKKSRNIR